MFDDKDDINIKDKEDNIVNNESNSIPSRFVMEFLVAKNDEKQKEDDDEIPLKFDLFGDED